MEKLLTDRYPGSMRLFHWFMALLFLGMFTVGYFMAEMERGAPGRHELYFLHKSTGVLIFLLVWLRMVTRLASTVPPLPGNIKPVYHELSHAVHWLIYAFMIVTPITGYALSNMFDKAVTLYGLPLPSIFPVDKDMAEKARDVHFYVAYGFLAVIGLHIAAVIKHRLDKHDVLKRML